METSITTPGGSTESGATKGLHERATQAPVAVGKNTLTPGKQPSPGFNQSGVLTTGEIEGKAPDLGALLGVANSANLAETPYRGPGHDPEKPLTALRNAAGG